MQGRKARVQTELLVLGDCVLLTLLEKRRLGVAEVSGLFSVQTSKIADLLRSNLNMLTILLFP